MPDALVGIGSNVDARRALATAAAALERRFEDVSFSAIYRSPAVGPSAADYLNMVAALATTASAADLRQELRVIEAACGRNRVDPLVCELDLDLLLYGECVDADQRLPLPGAFSVPYVVVPLAELRPELKNPLTGEVCALAAQRLAHALERVSLDG